MEIDTRMRNMVDRTRAKEWAITELDAPLRGIDEDEVFEVCAGSKSPTHRQPQSPTEKKEIKRLSFEAAGAVTLFRCQVSCFSQAAGTFAYVAPLPVCKTSRLQNACLFPVLPATFNKLVHLAFL